MATITVTVPSGTPQGLYNLTADVRSGGESILVKKLFVSVAEAPASGGVPVATITDVPASPTGGTIAIGDDLAGILAIIVVAIAVILFALLIKELADRRN